MNALSLQLLGEFQARFDNRPITNFRTKATQALLIYLATEPEQAHSRELLMSLLWPGMPDKSARANLRQTLYQLRQEIPEVKAVSTSGERAVPLVVANRNEIQLNPAAAVEIDVLHFEQRLSQTTRHQHLELFLCADCRQHLEAAAALYRDHFLLDFYLEDSNEFEEWAHARRELYRRKVLDALENLTTIYTRQEAYAEAETFVERQLEIDNLRERAYRQLMTLLTQSGRREEALAVYDRCRRLLAEELSMEPAARTSELYEKIRHGDLTPQAPVAQGVRGLTLREVIGEGAAGVIHRAYQPSVGRNVAVKVIRRKFANDPEFIRRFEMEAQLVARLEHPNIVPLYDYWRDPDGAYLVMRYVKEGSLEKALKGGAWDAKRTSRLVEQIAAALAAAHLQGVVHRDLKPANILLDGAGNAYLTDFGIAKDLTGEVQMTGEGSILGTLDYISPEQIKNEPIMPQADIYSFGAVIYEILTGEKPFGKTSVVNLLYSHVNEPFPMISANRADLPVAVDAVLQKATAKRPGDRYDSVLEMAQAFKRAIEPQAPQVTPYEVEQRAIAMVAEPYNPYKGLSAFQEADADDFFGQDGLVERLIARLSPQAAGNGRFLALVGPSGSGKSSAVKAGLFPALRTGAIAGSEKWFMAEMTPGTEPLDSFAQALLPLAVDPPANLVQPMSRDLRGLLRTIRRVLPADEAGATPQMLLFIDQFEEFFTLVTDSGQRTFFLDSLLAALNAPRSPLRLVITLRADFYDRPLQQPHWGQLLKENTEIILPLSQAELTWSVREPARRMGVTLEEGLVETIVADVADQAGGLPLLQYALTELFDHRHNQRIGWTAYEEIGGVLAALGRRADEEYAKLDEGMQAAARQLFLRLVTLGESSEDTRRRVLRSELEALELASESEGNIGNLINAFGQARLLTFDRDPLTREPTVEVAHEALLREWLRLREWLEEGRNDIRMQRLLAQGAAEWHKAGQDPSYLLRGSRLEQFVGWSDISKIDLTRDERAFLKASQAERWARAAEEEARRQRELETAQKLAETERTRAEEQTKAAGSLRQRAYFLVGALVIAGVLAVVAFGFARSSTSNANIAATRAAEAVLSSNLAATSEAAAVVNANLAVTREVEAQRERETAIQAQATTQAAAAVQATAEAIAVLERAQAEQQTALAISRELSLASINNLESDPELSMLLAIQALETSYTKGAEEALHRALQASRTLMVLTDHRDVVSRVTYSPNADYLASLSVDNTVKVWEMPGGQLLHTLTLPSIMPGRAVLAFNNLGTELIVASPDLDQQSIHLIIWRIPSGEVARSRTLPIPTDQWSGFTLNPDWTHIAVGYEDGRSELWDVATGELLFIFSALDDWAADLSFSHDGARLAVSSPNKRVVIWDIPASLTTGDSQQLATFISPSDNLPTGFIFSGDNSLGAIGFADGSIEVWSLSNTETPLFSFSGQQTISGLAFSVDNLRLASGSYDGIVNVWDLTSGELQLTLAGHTLPVGGVAFSPDGSQLATASQDSTVRIWQALPQVDGELFTFAVGHPTWDLALSPDERLIAFGNVAGAATLWEATTGRQLLRLPGNVREDGSETAVYSVSFHPAGERIATVGEDNVIRIWEIATGELLLSWIGHGEGEVGGLFTGTMDVSYSPDGQHLATSGTDGIAKVWDADTGEEVFAMDGHTDGLFFIAYSPDGTMIATSSDQADTTVKVWDAESGAEIYTLEGHPVRVFGLAFSPDSRLLATSGYQGVVKLWDMTTGKEIYTLPSQISTVANVSFSPDGQQLITSGGDALRVWDVATGEELKTIADDRFGIDLTQDGRYLYASHPRDGVVRVYTLLLADTIALAHQRLTRSLTVEECQQYLHVNVCPEE